MLKECLQLLLKERTLSAVTTRELQLVNFLYCMKLRSSKQEHSTVDAAERIGSPKMTSQQ